MDRKEKYIYIFLAVLTPFALGAMVWAVTGISAERVDSGLITLTVLTVFCSCYLRIQLPRVSMHLTISDALIMLAILWYGGQVAIAIVVIETTIASLNLMRQKGVALKFKTVVFNVVIAVLAVFVAAKAVTLIFGSTDLILQRNELTSLVWLLGVMALSLFLVNSVFAAIYSAIKSKRAFWRVWTGNCFDAVVMYLSGAVMTGFLVKAFDQNNLQLLAAVVGFFGVVYVTFRHFIEDVKKTVEKAKQAESE